MPDLEIADATNAAPLLGAEIIPCDDGGADGRFTAFDMMEFVQDKGADTASAGTLVLGNGSYFHITGTTTITDIDFTNTWDGRMARLIFDGSLTLTHHATTLIIPGGQNIKTSAGDSCTIIVDAGDNVRIVQYERASQGQFTNPGNASVTNQSIAAAQTNYLANSNIAIPTSLLAIKTILRWSMSVEKTAAGTAANSWLVKLGTAGTTGDATILTFALPVGTAVADKGRVDIEVVIRGPLGASCVASGLFTLSHNLAATGLSTFPGVALQVVSGTFNSTTAALIAGIAVTTAASTVLNFQQVVAESINL